MSETASPSPDPAQDPARADTPPSAHSADFAGGVLRVLDANANRASEGLRVVEEYFRFVLQDAFRCQTAKTLRHELTELLSTPELSRRWSMRNAPGDVGAEATTPSEFTRQGARDVAQASFHRAEQAMRCLEEYVKLLAPSVAAKLESLRFRIYQLEFSMLSLFDSKERLSDCRLYALIDGTSTTHELSTRVKQLMLGGVDVIQLRHKQLNDRELLACAKRLREATAGECLLIINDRVDIAMACGADGVHLGQDDMSIGEARRLLGPEPLIGISTHNLKQVEQAALQGASYLGCGPTFPSKTKSFDEFPGLPFLEQVMAATNMPWFAIGGIDSSNLEQLTSIGVRCIAVGNAIWNSAKPRAAAYQLRNMLIEANQAESLSRCLDDSP